MQNKILYFFQLIMQNKKMKKLFSLFALLSSMVIFSANICFADGKSKKVACGGEYSSYKHSRDGSSVCAGGEYSSYKHSRDGTDVACGGEYSSYKRSRDGSSVCAGGKYSSYKHAP